MGYLCAFTSQTLLNEKKFEYTKSSQMVQAITFVCYTKMIDLPKRNDIVFTQRHPFYVLILFETFLVLLSFVDSFDLFLESSYFMHLRLEILRQSRKYLNEKCIFSFLFIHESTHN